MKIGVALRFIGGHWAYSEIFKFQKQDVNFNSSDESDLLRQIHFALLFLQAAEFHRSEKDLNGAQHLVDRKGMELFRGAAVLGSRVLLGLDADIDRRVKKPFPCKVITALAAEIAALKSAGGRRDRNPCRGLRGRLPPTQRRGLVQAPDQSHAAGR